MIYDVVMPQYGLTMTEATLTQWLKKPGDSVAKGELLFSIETDKVTADIESPRSGKVTELLAKPSQVIDVGTVIAKLELTAAEAAAEPEAPAQKAATPATPVATAKSPQPEPTRPPARPAGTSSAAGRPVLASPRAKKLAREQGIDLQAVGAHLGKDHLVEADVRSFSEQRGPVASSKGDVKEAPSAVRRAIAQRLTASIQQVPHFYLDRMADATELVKLSKAMFPEVEKQAGVHLTITDVLLKALARGLREHPEVNASWQEDGILRRQNINVGIAIQTPTRLLVAVVRDADKLPLTEVGRKRSELVEKAKAGKLVPTDMEGASCTLSNLGPFGVDHFHAIINPPESSILAVGRIAERAVVVDGAVVPRPTISLSLSVDHRLIDGALAAGFLGSIVHAIENPYILLIS